MDKVLEVKSYIFAIDLAVLASRREMLALDQWLQNRISVGQDIFARACLDYINEGIPQDGQAKAKRDLPVETIAGFLQNLLGRYVFSYLIFDSLTAD